jgi:hypothetical protein
MARGTPSVSKGSVGAVGSGQRKAVVSHIKNLATAYLVSGNAAWVQADYYNLATYDYRILHSVGSPLLVSGAGDADLWVVLQEYASGIYVRSMSDYCPSADTYQRLTSTSSSSIGISDTAAYDWWCVVNDYEFFFGMVQSGTMYGVWFGQPLNGLSDTSAIGGRARLTADTSTTGNGIVLSLDRDLTGKLTVGQKIYLLNQTVDGAGSLANDFCEIVTVASVGSSTVTVDGVVNQPYKTGSLIGLYPFCCVSVGNITNFMTYLFSAILPNSTSGASVFATANTFFSSGLEANMDPDYAGIYRMGRMYIPAAGSAGYYGISEIIFACPLGTQATGDRMLIDNDSARAYWIFPNLNSSAFGGGCTCVGPGATV